MVAADVGAAVAVMTRLLSIMTATSSFEKHKAGDTYSDGDVVAMSGEAVLIRWHPDGAWVTEPRPSTCMPAISRQLLQLWPLQLIS